MQTFRHEFIVQCEIEAVWDFFTDPQHFEMISPENLKETLIECSTPKLGLGTDVWISTSLFFKRIWHSRIIKFEQYEYVDEVHSGLMKKWIHRHEFIRSGNGQTLAIDEIMFELGYGIIGIVGERLVMAKLGPIFQHRERRAKEILDKK